jgi:integrase
VADAWLEHVQQTNDPERYRLCRDRINEFLAFIGGSIKVRELRPRHVEDWVASKTNVTKDGTKRLYKAMILASLNWAAAAANRLIAFNPLRGKLVLPEGGSRGGDAVWTPDIFKLVLANVNQNFGDFLRACAWTGARPSTLRHVEARHYVPHLKLWDVEDLYRDRASKRKYVRRIGLGPAMTKLVERLNRLYPAGPIFRNTQGMPYSADAVTMMMYKLRVRLRRKGIELPPGICVYGLRHSFASQFIAQYPDKLEYLRQLLGHSSLKMIYKHYNHLIDDHSAMHSVLDIMSVLT